MRYRSRAVLAAALLAGTGLSVHPAAAQQDSISQEFSDIRNAVGLGPTHPPMDFSERPPLVVPPNNNLPQPGVGQSDNLGVRDPDTANRLKARTDPRRPVPTTDPGASAVGRDSRTYLIDPPAGLRDPEVVKADITHDANGLPVAPAKRARVHRKKKLTAVSAQ